MDPRAEPPKVSSTLEWKDVPLPKELTVVDLDALILSALHWRWMETAGIIGDVIEACRSRGLFIGEQVIGARIRELAETRRILSAGDVSMWRHSEIRRPLP
jgi:hypothetical protein